MNVAVAPTERGRWSDHDLDVLHGMMRGKRVLALCGAGCSTESGIPDYRSPKALEKPRNPMRHDRFVSSADARARYWARSMLGWPQMSHARPNAAHRALAALEHAGHLTGLITQNVDGLHHAAGSRDVLELHGALRRVRCLGCDARVERQWLQERLVEANPHVMDGAGRAAPDGDADVDEVAVSGFHVVACTACGGVLMPDVVFFGGSVPAPWVERAWAMLAAADVLLVVGSSLTVFSGFRFARRAAEEGKPVLIINLGPTRADELARVRVEARVGDFLPGLVARLAG